jgi:hypothetical protein
MARSARLWLMALGVIAVLAAGAFALLGPRATVPAERPGLGLFTSLPILWNEAPDIAAQLASPGPPHWARGELEARYRVEPLDVLAPPATLRLLVIAQPRPLAPEENVALDAWVRGGGRVLLLADPLLTWESRFALGDRRRPQDAVLLSPILARWGLELRFDEDQAEGEHDLGGLPVNLPGVLAARPGGFESRCVIEHSGLVADCAIGKGHATIVADAALLEPGEAEADHAQAFEVLLERAFPG